MVALRCGPQQLHEQQRVTHDPLHRLDQERAQIDVVCFTPEKQTHNDMFFKKATLNKLCPDTTTEFFHVHKVRSYSYGIYRYADEYQYLGKPRFKISKK